MNSENYEYAQVSFYSSDFNHFWLVNMWPTMSLVVQEKGVFIFFYKDCTWFNFSCKYAMLNLNIFYLGIKLEELMHTHTHLHQKSHTIIELTSYHHITSITHISSDTTQNWLKYKIKLLVSYYAFVAWELIKIKMSIDSCFVQSSPIIQGGCIPENHHGYKNYITRLFKHVIIRVWSHSYGNMQSDYKH